MTCSYISLIGLSFDFLLLLIALLGLALPGRHPLGPRRNLELFDGDLVEYLTVLDQRLQ